MFGFKSITPEVKYKDTAAEPLIGDEESPGSSENSTRLRTHSSRRHSWILSRYAKPISPWIFHGLLMLVNTVICAVLVISLIRINGPHEQSENKHEPHHYPLPAREGLQWEKRRFPTKIDGNSLVGEPRDELHDAWHELLQNDNIKVPRDYLDELGLNSIYTKDGREGIASLSVYHSLHCLKKVHQMMYKEFYHADKTSIAMHREIRHADHCLEYVREHVMCQPDLSLVTFRWINNTAQHPDFPAQFYATNFDASEHTCAKWEPLDAWAGTRVFNLSNLDQLQRPGVDGDTVVTEIRPIKGEPGYEPLDAVDSN